ncbi:MAG: hypothetical protein JWO31_2335 [Phycisphaerales bacterium]|nr:hypothetical protein [Phycisphaerales bacterium]
MLRRFVHIRQYECEVVELDRVIGRDGRPVPCHVRLDKGRVEIDRNEPDPNGLIRDAVAIAEAAIDAANRDGAGRVVRAADWAGSRRPSGEASASPPAA